MMGDPRADALVEQAWLARGRTSARLAARTTGQDAPFRRPSSRRLLLHRLAFCYSRQVDIVYEHADLICTTRAPVFLALWRRTPSPTQAAAVIENMTRFAKATPGGIIFVVVTGSDVGAPDRVSGDIMARGIRSMEKYILAHAFIMEGSGLKAGAIRTAVRAMQTLTRVIFPWTIAASVDEGFLWLARKAGFLAEEEARVFVNDIAALRTVRPTRV
jgi:hypothetical protein